MGHQNHEEEKIFLGKIFEGGISKG